MTPLDPDTILDIQKFVADTKQLDGQIGRFEFASAEQVKNAAAPHYIFAHCAPNDAAYANVGYVLQNADLYIQSKGLGSVWLGMAKPKDPADDYCIMLAFGKTDVPARKTAQEFKRLPLKEISDADNNIANAARLAPSAVNSQPWRLHFEKDKVFVRYVGRGIMQRILKKMNKIDVGIITRHVATALEHDGKTIRSIRANGADKEFEIEIDYS
jgi:hypothetical protein